MAFYAFRLQPGDQILTTHDEYASSNMPAGTVRFHVAGEIEADNYEDVLVPELLRALEAGGGLRTLYVIDDLDEIEPGALWADTSSVSTAGYATTTRGSVRRS